jgi:hypothetical protein
MPPHRAKGDVVMRATCLAIVVGAGLLAPFAALAPAAAGELQSAEAATAALSDFAGPWVGSTGPNVEVMRNATVLIEKKGQGFVVTWTTIESTEDKPAAPVTQRKRTIAFEPTKRAGLWRATGANDPAAGYAAWAYIKGRTLTVAIVAVLADGRLERQVYDRMLTPKGMKLYYRRFVEGNATRTIEAEFLKLNPTPQ